MVTLDLSYTNIKELPFLIKEFPHFRHIFLANKEFDLPYIDIIEFSGVVNLEENLNLKSLSEKLEHRRKK